MYVRNLLTGSYRRIIFSYVVLLGMYELGFDPRFVSNKATYFQRDYGDFTYALFYLNLKIGIIINKIMKYIFLNSFKSVSNNVILINTVLLICLNFYFYRNNSIACLRAKAQEHQARLLNSGIFLQVRSFADMQQRHQQQQQQLYLNNTNNNKNCDTKSCKQQQFEKGLNITAMSSTSKGEGKHDV